VGFSAVIDDPRTEVTVALMEEVVVTSVLKFTVPDSFAIDRMKGWLASAMK
jgi:hypothetical protein